MRRCITSSPLMALALLLLFLCLSPSAAAARLLPLQQPAGVRPLAPHHQADNGVTAAAADGLVIQEEEAAGDDDELSISEMNGEGVEQAVTCEEGNDDQCLQRRLLYAHLESSDYSPSRRSPPAN